MLTELISCYRLFHLLPFRSGSRTAARNGAARRKCETSGQQLPRTRIATTRPSKLSVSTLVAFIWLIPLSDSTGSSPVSGYPAMASGIPNPASAVSDVVNPGAYSGMHSMTQNSVSRHGKKFFLKKIYWTLRVLTKHTNTRASKPSTSDNSLAGLNLLSFTSATQTPLQRADWWPFRTRPHFRRRLCFYFWLFPYNDYVFRVLLTIHLTAACSTLHLVLTRETKVSVQKYYISFCKPHSVF